jgi:hypothetical protein
MYALGSWSRSGLSWVIRLSSSDLVLPSPVRGYRTTWRRNDSPNSLVKACHEVMEGDWQFLLHILQIIDMGLVK